LIGEVADGSGMRVEPLPLHQLIDLPIDPSELAVVTIGEPGWASEAIDQLLNDESICLIDDDAGLILVQPWDLPSRRRPVWGQLRKILLDAGVRVPRVRWSR